MSPCPCPTLLVVATIQVPVNDKGRRIGQGHPRASVEDAIVALIRRTCEAEGLGWRRAARRFSEYNPEWIKAILSGRRRSQVAYSWRHVEVAHGEDS